jgi:hypothetical protein
VVDSFLLTHSTEPLLYDISAYLSPFSIRDQMIRGYLIIERAQTAGLIGGTRELLVVGAGLAGVMAAVTAAQQKIHVTLIDKGEILGKLAEKAKRFIDPTLYDWPALHWQRARFPFNDRSTMPLKYTHHNAAAIVSAWIASIHEAEDSGYLKILRYTQLVSYLRQSKNPAYPENQIVKAYLKKIPSPGASGEVDLPPEKHEFGMVLSCVGFGKEKCTVGKYTGYDFWDDSLYEEPNFGLTGGEKPNVLISGAGDGALQDFLLATTNQESPGEIYKAIKKKLPKNVLAWVEKKIHNAEDQARRTFHWGPGTDRDHDTLKSLQLRHKRVVNLLLEKYWECIDEALLDIVKDLEHEINVKLLHKCDHFTNCYALNRFLVLLISDYVLKKSENRIKTIYPKTMLVEIEGHGCNNTAPDCHGQGHEVLYVRAANCFEEPDTDKSNYHYAKDGPYNVIIIRHGVDPSHPLFNKLPISNPRQILPYYLDKTE